MARARKPGRITIGSRAVAVAILSEAIGEASELASGARLEDPAAGAIADKLVGMAWDVEYKPTVERLVIIIDAGITSGDKMRSTPEDQPEAYAQNEDERCPGISNGNRCLLKTGHDGVSHLFEPDLEP